MASLCSSGNKNLVDEFLTLNLKIPAYLSVKELSPGMNLVDEFLTLNLKIPAYLSVKELSPGITLWMSSLP